jgi:hypothetical protein
MTLGADRYREYALCRFSTTLFANDARARALVATPITVAIAVQVIQGKNKFELVSADIQ